jgi:hypothetical protein
MNVSGTRECAPKGEVHGFKGGAPGQDNNDTNAYETEKESTKPRVAFPILGRQLAFR